MGMESTAAASSFPACGSIPAFCGKVSGSETSLDIASFLVEPSVCLKMAAGGFALPLKKYDLKGVQTWH